MRWTLALILNFACSTQFFAAPLELPEPARPPLAPQEARAYAQQLVSVVNSIALAYVRPVARAELFYGALAGLYEATDRPVPEGLQAELTEKIKDTSPALDLAQDAVQRMSESEAAVQLLARLREDIGNDPRLQGRALQMSLEALTRRLDPYSALIDQREVRRTHGEMIHHGLGIELAAPDTAPLQIKSVTLGSPAQRAGLRPGDQITHIDGKPVEELPVSVIVLRIPDGGTAGDAAANRVELTVLPAGKTTPRRLKLQRGEYRPETVFGVRRTEDGTWDHMLDPRQKVGYVRIGSLEHGTAEDLHRVLTRLQADQVRGLVLDLRWSPGGFLNEAVWIARQFLKEGVIATVRGRRPREEQVYKAEADGFFTDLPLIVLVNGETMGGAELIAAALEDNRRATIAGQRSFGKASVQSMVSLPYGEMALKLTTGNFLRPSGKALHRFPDSKPGDDWGVRPAPALEIRLSSDLSAQLREWSLLQGLRPGPSAEVLPLDDPEKDPQRQRALMGLRELLKK
jgi:carboxyl-terminal processing protease